MVLPRYGSVYNTMRWCMEKQISDYRRKCRKTDIRLAEEMSKGRYEISGGDVKSSQHECLWPGTHSHSWMKWSNVEWTNFLIVWNGSKWFELGFSRLEIRCSNCCDTAPHSTEENMARRRLSRWQGESIDDTAYSNVCKEINMVIMIYDLLGEKGAFWNSMVSGLIVVLKNYTPEAMFKLK